MKKQYLTAAALGTLVAACFAASQIGNIKQPWWRDVLRALLVPVFGTALAGAALSLSKQPAELQWYQIVLAAISVDALESYITLLKHEWMWLLPASVTGAAGARWIAQHTPAATGTLFQSKSWLRFGQWLASKIFMCICFGLCMTWLFYHTIEMVPVHVYEDWLVLACLQAGGIFCACLLGTRLLLQSRKLVNSIYLGTACITIAAFSGIVLLIATDNIQPELGLGELAYTAAPAMQFFLELLPTALIIGAVSGLVIHCYASED